MFTQLQLNKEEKCSRVGYFNVCQKICVHQGVFVAAQTGAGANKYLDLMLSYLTLDWMVIAAIPC